MLIQHIHSLTYSCIHVRFAGLETIQKNIHFGDYQLYFSVCVHVSNVFISLNIKVCKIFNLEYHFYKKYKLWEFVSAYYQLCLCLNSNWETKLLNNFYLTIIIIIFLSFKLRCHSTNLHFEIHCSPTTSLTAAATTITAQCVMSMGWEDKIIFCERYCFYVSFL